MPAWCEKSCSYVCISGFDGGGDTDGTKVCVCSAIARSKKAAVKAIYAQMVCVQEEPNPIDWLRHPQT